MIRVEDTANYTHLFESYDHNIAVIFAHLEGQYPCSLYVDDKGQSAILFTDFDFHYLVGDKTNVNWFKRTIKTYLKDKKEAIFIPPNEAWYGYMDEIFQNLSDIRDDRYIYKLDSKNFKGRTNHETKISYDRSSGKTFPVATINDGNEVVSKCSAFMLGKSHGELDIKTEEAFQNKGYARAVASHLISELLDKKIEPDWQAWSFRSASRHLAEALGFKLKKVVKAYIWVEEVCGKIEDEA